MYDSLEQMVSVPKIKVAIHADTAVEDIEAEIRAFEKSLSPDEEVGAMLAHFGHVITIAVERIGYRNPYLVMFYGTRVSDGQRCTLVQHMNQLSVLLLALPAKDPKHPRRIGFQQPTSDEPSTTAGGSA